MAALPPGKVSNQTRSALTKKNIITITCSALVFLLLILAIVLYYRRYRRRHIIEHVAVIKKDEDTVPFEKPELDHASAQVVQLRTPTPELDVTERVELSPDQTWQKHELRGSREEPAINEMPNLIGNRQELADSVLVGTEMLAEPVCASQESECLGADETLPCNLEKTKSKLL